MTLPEILIPDARTMLREAVLGKDPALPWVARVHAAIRELDAALTPATVSDSKE